MEKPNVQVDEPDVQIEEQNVQEEDKDVDFAQLQDTLSKTHLQIAYLQRENREIRYTEGKVTQQNEKGMSKKPPMPTTQEKGKQVISVE